MLLVLVSFAFSVGCLSYLACKSEMHTLKHDLLCQTNILAAVVGDSRVECYFDPGEIPWLRNFGLSATPFSITAHKAKLIVDLNKQLQFIIVDVWPLQFFSSLDVPFAASVPYGCALLEMTTRYDMPPLGDGFEVRWSKGVLVPWCRNLFKNTSEAKGQLTGKFYKNHKFLKYDINDDEHIYDQSRPPPRTPENLPSLPTGGETILIHLLEHMKRNNVKVVLTTTPILWYERRWTSEARAYFERRMTEISADFDVTWYNWINEYHDKSDYWADGTHLNDIGAKVFSRDKRNILERHLRGNH